MVSSAEQSGVRRKSKKRKGLTLADIMPPDDPEKKEEWAAKLRQAEYERPELSFLQKWGYPLCTWHGDPQATEIISRLYELFLRLSASEKHLYLRTAEAIAEAEIAKHAWNPKANRDRYYRVARHAIAAAKLATELNSVFPSPWKGNSAPMGELIERLGSLVAGSLHASIPMDRHVSARQAFQLTRTTKQRLEKKARSTHWELVRDLVWLASGKKIELSERSVRRYLERVRRVNIPARELISRNWELIRTASRFASERGRELFEANGRDYLKDI